MAKKSKKRSKKRKQSFRPELKQAPAQIWQSFKSLWKAGEWLQSLSCYRTWTNKTGRKRSPVIEGELLFRCASSYFREGNLGRSLNYLEEAIARDPDNISRYLFCKAVCLAKQEQLSASMNLWKELKDDFHQSVLSYFIEQKRPLPRKLPGDLAIERSQLIRFWKSLANAKNAAEIETANNALKNIGQAFLIFSAASDPEPQLKLLQKKTGFDSLAAYLLLLSAIYKRRKVKVRNLIKKSPFPELIDIHLRTLFREKNYDEIAYLDKLLRERGIQSGALDSLRDELFFNLGLREIEENRLENALAYFLEINNKTPAVLHNTALLYQKMARYEAANEIWIRLLKQEKKPKRSDPEELRLAYTTNCKYIAQNFLHNEQPEEAQKYFKEVLTLIKDDQEALEALVTISEELDNPREALLYARRLYELEPENDEFRFSYIMELQKNKELDTLIPLYRKELERDPENFFYKEGLAYCYIHTAWPLRHQNPVEAKRLMKEVKKLGCFHGRLRYLEGYFLLKKGKKEEAGKKFEQALKKERDHMGEFQLGMSFYEDGLMDFSRKAFDCIVTCGCAASLMIFKMIVKFLAQRDDQENTVRMCDYGLNHLGYYLYNIAGMLFDYKKPSLAKIYSSRLIEADGADKNDRFLHLLILNETGEKMETLDYLGKLREDAVQRGDSDYVLVYKEMTRQVKARGRFKNP